MNWHDRGRLGFGPHSPDDDVAEELAQHAAATYAVLLGTFAAFALAIAGVGLFGVLSYSVAPRARVSCRRAAPPGWTR